MLDPPGTGSEIVAWDPAMWKSIWDKTTSIARQWSLRSYLDFDRLSRIPIGRRGPKPTRHSGSVSRDCERAKRLIECHGGFRPARNPDQQSNETNYRNCRRGELGDDHRWKPSRSGIRRLTGSLWTTPMTHRLSRPGLVDVRPNHGLGERQKGTCINLKASSR